MAILPYAVPVETAEVARRLRLSADLHPLRLPVRRRIDERHHVEINGLEIWFTQQLSGRAVIYEAVFKGRGDSPSDQQCELWLAHLLPDHRVSEVPGIPGSDTRRFEVIIEPKGT